MTDDLNIGYFHTTNGLFFGRDKDNGNVHIVQAAPGCNKFPHEEGFVTKSRRIVDADSWCSVVCGVAVIPDGAELHEQIKKIHMGEV